MKLQIIIALVVVWLVTVIGSGLGGWLYGRTQGKATVQQECLQADIAVLTRGIEQIDQLSKQAKADNVVLSKAIAARIKADQQSTQELRHALSITAPARVDCRFDSVVMQLLQQTADRADAAATGGVNGAVPAGAAPY